MMGEIGFPHMELTIVYCDNESTIQVAHNPVAYDNMKYVELYANYLGHLVQEKMVTLVYCGEYYQT